MKQLSYIIALGFRVLIFTLVFSSIILQPVVKSMAISQPQAFSWLEFETESDSSEKENQEVEDSKDKKVELRLTTENRSVNIYYKKGSIYSGQYFRSDVTIETHHPPPEVG